MVAGYRGASGERSDAPDAAPRITVIRHRRERPSKCSLTPIEGLAGISFHAYPADHVDLANHVRLALEGPLLSPADRGRPLLILDGSWRHAARMHHRYANVEPRSLPKVVTAYPRVSKIYPDPEHGLASIEALIAACVILGHDAGPLLAAYDRAADFVARNPAFFTPHGTRERNPVVR